MVAGPASPVEGKQEPVRRRRQPPPAHGLGVPRRVRVYLGASPAVAVGLMSSSTMPRLLAPWSLHMSMKRATLS